MESESSSFKARLRSSLYYLDGVTLRHPWEFLRKFFSTQTSSFSLRQIYQAPIIAGVYATFTHPLALIGSIFTANYTSVNSSNLATQVTAVFQRFAKPYAFFPMPIISPSLFFKNFTSLFLGYHSSLIILRAYATTFLSQQLRLESTSLKIALSGLVGFGVGSGLALLHKQSELNLSRSALQISQIKSLCPSVTFKSRLNLGVREGIFNGLNALICFLVLENQKEKQEINFEITSLKVREKVKTSESSETRNPGFKMGMIMGVIVSAYNMVVELMESGRLDLRSAIIELMKNRRYAQYALGLQLGRNVMIYLLVSFELSRLF